MLEIPEHLDLKSIIAFFPYSVGLKIIGYFIFKFIAFIYRSFIRSGKNLKKYGSWAVVTGATDGIGKAYCEEFAKKGLNICLVSRSLDKLKTEAQAIESKFKVQTRVVQFDFSTDDNAKYDGLYSQIADLDIGILVNNVGVSYDHPMYLDELPINAIENLINLNIRSASILTKLVLPNLIKKKSGAIINISSISGVNTVPLLTVYSATKAFIEKFSLGLNLEYGSKGIFVQCVTPAIVCSKLSKVRRANLFQPMPSTFARSAVKTIGYDKLTTGYWTHEIQNFALHYLPAFIVDKYMFSMHLGQRSRALAKKKSS
ncbi:steroid dehydrogenase [Tieghemostelium lacteum]|uniref:Steroid dehydrogenase n=1 Tax=Tieghemostelium lacteum TaxID=361077 RepID=A0A151ZCU2_TIELA|nr:steroid dehydrogenase [Tieghemostelium lacteum]|eukprot:KYQ91751.1 steroid dehydrogenase [Tieghemostelium lacteum]